MTPIEVLYDTGPRIFVSKAPTGSLLLAYESFASADGEELLVVESDRDIINALRTGERSVRSALEHGSRAWLVVIGHDGSVRSETSVSVSSMPANRLPLAGFTLIPGVMVDEHSTAFARAYNDARAHNELRTRRSVLRAEWATEFWRWLGIHRLPLAASFVLTGVFLGIFGATRPRKVLVATPDLTQLSGKQHYRRDHGAVFPGVE